MAAPVRKNHAILLRFPGFAYHFAKYHLQRGEIPHCPTLICLIPGFFFDTLPAQLISGMNRQLLEEIRCASPLPTRKGCSTLISQ